MRLVVTGREGQVARSLVERALGRTDIDVVTVGRPELDLARPETIAPAIAACRPDVVVSAAAYTAVDQAEDEPDLAHAVNAVAAGEVARAAGEIGVPVIHLSTDYVFSGDKPEPYVETDATGPIGVYGKSKLAGEIAVAAANPRHVILRTAWVYSPFGKNFVKTMLRLAETRDELSVVSDQWGNPTSALDIADAVLAACERLRRKEDAQTHGVFHLAGTGDATWADFAEEIFRASTRLGGPGATVRRITTGEYPTKAARPANSRLDSRRFGDVFGYSAPDWRRSVQATVAQHFGKSRETAS